MAIVLNLPDDDPTQRNDHEFFFTSIQKITSEYIYQNSSSALPESKIRKAGTFRKHAPFRTKRPRSTEQMSKAAASSSGASASTPGGLTRVRPRFERKSDAERAAKKASISAAHPITPTCELDRWGQTLLLHGMSYEDKMLLHKDYVSAHGHIMADEPYVTYSGSKNEGQNNYPHYPLSAAKADAYVPKMPVTSLQHARDVVEVCKLKWPKSFFKPPSSTTSALTTGQSGMRFFSSATATSNPP